MAPPERSESFATGDNRLLSALIDAGLDELVGDLEVDEYESGAILSEPYEPVQFVYFPYSCVVSIVNTVAGGSTVEVGTVGNEGMAGIAVYLDSGVTPNRTLVQVPGKMARLSAASFNAIAERSPEIRKLLNRFTLAFLAQVSQTAACNRAHTIDERCARWLLMTHDRVEGDAFSLTHEFLAYMLGVRRAGVTIAAGILQKAGLISYRRGHIKIIDRKGLEDASCDCYGIVRREFEKLVGSPTG